MGKRFLAKLKNVPNGITMKNNLLDLNLDLCTLLLNDFSLLQISFLFITVTLKSEPTVCFG